MSLKELTYRVRVERTLRRPPTSANAGSNDQFMAAARYTHSLSCYLISVNGKRRQREGGRDGLYRKREEL